VIYFISAIVLVMSCPLIIAGEFITHM